MVLDYAEKAGLDDIWKIAAVFERYTNLTQFYNEAKNLQEQKEKQKKAAKTRMATRKRKLLRKFRKSLKTNKTK
jgi:hypothetical protein